MYICVSIVHIGVMVVKCDLLIGFVGLVNQAMTCYLNSLLQTLYMTPEFRNTLYRFVCISELLLLYFLYTIYILSY